MNGTKILALIANRDIRKLLEMVKQLNEQTPEAISEKLNFHGNTAGDPLRILALVTVLVIRDWRGCLLAILERVKAEHLEIPVLTALDTLRKKVI